MTDESTSRISRREILGILTALGITGPLAAQAAAQARPTVTDEALRQAAALLGGSFTPARLDVTRRALQRNLDQFQVVRDLDIGDDIEPPTIFLPKR
jgi:hypothetical protein